MSAIDLPPPPGPWQEWAADQRSGFVVGRMLSALMNEAFWAVGQGVATRQDVDLAMKRYSRCHCRCGVDKPDARNAAAALSGVAVDGVQVACAPQEEPVRRA
jgi:3-hydroxyacyl-CoA dehydrogenase, C-terminal domain